MSNYKFPGLGAEDEPTTGATLTRRVYEALRDEIINGQLRQGERLVRKKVASRLGVSPMPVTEALYMLELDGLVESRALCGCRVRPLTIEDVDDALVLREAVECQAARLCAERASKADLSRLEALSVKLDRMALKGDPESSLGMQLHLDLHLGIAEATRHKTLAAELQRVWFRRYMRLNWISSSIINPPPANWHQRLMKAIAGNNPDKADAAMREHVRFGSQSSRESLDYYLQHLADKP